MEKPSDGGGGRYPTASPGLGAMKALLQINEDESTETAETSGRMPTLPVEDEMLRVIDPPLID